ncbi:PREDICTED: pentatricopeptide repeat-containing protein At1g50270 [Lupinus angustifolius]|nr:PREDICTED: pentatricopeptide repeat-containing protein At1g50270 [Lupinus angustifolius]
MIGFKLVSSLIKNHKNLEKCKHIQSIIITSGLLQHTLFLAKFLQLQPLPIFSPFLSFLFNIISHTPNNATRFFNKIIATFSTSPHPQSTLLCYATMRQNGVVPDQHTFPLLLKMFSKSNLQDSPFMVFAQIVTFGLDTDHFVSNALVSAFANSGFMLSAHQVFDQSSSKDVVAWTALINGYVKNDCPSKAIKCFLDMRSTGTRIDGVTIVSILRAAAMVGDAYFGKWVHGFYVLAGRVELDSYICSALVDMYFKCGHCDDAWEVFDEMPYRNVVSWTTVIAGYVQCNKFQDAQRVFSDMMLTNIMPNEFTLTSVLSACAHTGALDQGRLVHQYIECNKVKLNSALGTALVDMYAKCGCIGEAVRVFENLLIKDVYTWTAMINGLAVHGDALGALNIFSCMLRNCIQPNEVTFIGVLSACSHGGFVEEGKRLFESMSKVYHLKPNMDHYGCMVDLLGRAGHLEDAKKIIDNMPMKPSPGVLGALFGACMIHKAFEMGECIGNNLINLQPNHSGRYALLANLYSMCRNWEAASQVRKFMKGVQVEKTPGYSWIEVNGLIHEFKAFDHSHNESSGVYSILDNLILQLNLAGQVLDCEDLNILGSNTGEG